jgi:hypothetical protein
MTTKIYSVLDIALMPLNAVRLIDGADELYMAFMEGEANYAMNEITRQTMNAGNRLVGHALTASLYVPQNKLDTSIAALNAFSGKLLELVEFDLGKINAEVTNYINTVNGSALMRFADCIEMTWRLESTEFRPRFIVSLSGFVPATNLTIF